VPISRLGNCRGSVFYTSFSAVTNRWSSNLEQTVISFGCSFHVACERQCETLLLDLTIEKKIDSQRFESKFVTSTSVDSTSLHFGAFLVTKRGFLNECDYQ